MQILCVFSVGSLEDINISELQQDSGSLPTDWNIHTGEMDGMYLGRCLPLSHVMPPWLSPRDCDPVLDSKLDSVYCRDISQSHCSMTYQPTVYVNCCYQDCYNFPQCCVECQHVSSSQPFSSSATDSPNVGRGVSGVLPAAARAALYFPASPADGADQYTLLTQTNNNMSTRNLSVHGCKAGKMLAQ